MRAGALLLACICAAACGGGAEAPLQVRALLLVTIDRLPSDAFRDARRMPLFSARAEDASWQHGELFANAESTAGALASLLTASAPERHGLRAAGALHEHGLDELAPPTLGARSSDAGWATAAFLPLPWLGRDFSGLGAAFDHETAPPAERGAPWTSAAELVPRVLEELRLRAESPQPFLVWVHLADARSDLAARSPHLASTLAARLTPFAESVPEVGPALELARTDTAAALRELRATVGRRRGSPERAALDAALLDAGLAEVDAAVDAFIAALERDPHWKGTAICVAGAGGPGRGLAPARLATAFALRLPHGLQPGTRDGQLPLAQLELGRELASLMVGPSRSPRSGDGADTGNVPAGLAALTAAGARAGAVAWLAPDLSGTPQLVVLDGLERAAVHAWPAGGVLTGAELPDTAERLRRTSGARVRVEWTGGAGPLDVQIESPLGELLAIELENGGGSARSHRTSERVGSAHLSAVGTVVAYTTTSVPELALGLTLDGRAPRTGEVACDGVALDVLPRPVLLRRRGEPWDPGAEPTWVLDAERPSARNDWRVRVAAEPGTSVELLARAWPPGRNAGLQLAPTTLESGGANRSEHPNGRPDHLQLNGTGALDVLLLLEGTRPELALAATVGGRPVAPAEIRFRGAHPDAERLTLALDARAWQKRHHPGPRASTPIRIEWTATELGVPVPRRGPRPLGPGARELLPSLPQDD